MIKTTTTIECDRCGDIWTSWRTDLYERAADAGWEIQEDYSYCPYCSDEEDPEDAEKETELVFEEFEVRPIEVRSSVQSFAEHMELKLRENDHKGGWAECSLLWLLAKLTEEVGELGVLLVHNYEPDGTLIPKRHTPRAGYVQEETIDIANVAMMLFELAGSLASQAEEPTGD